MTPQYFYDVFVYIAEPQLNNNSVLIVYSIRPVYNFQIVSIWKKMFLQVSKG